VSTIDIQCITMHIK